MENINNIENIENTEIIFGGIKSEKLLQLIEQVVEIIKNKNISRKMLEHIMYMLLRQIKKNYYAYSLGAKNLYILQSYLNFHDLNNVLPNKDFNFDTFIDDIVDNIQNIKSKDDLLNILNQYFVFVYKHNRQFIQQFSENFLSVGDILSGQTERSLLSQKPILESEELVIAKKNWILNYFNNYYDTFNFFDIRFDKIANFINIPFEYSIKLSNKDIRLLLNSNNKQRIYWFMKDLEINFQEIMSKSNFSIKRYSFFENKHQFKKFTLKLSQNTFPKYHLNDEQEKHLIYLYRIYNLYIERFNKERDYKRYLNAITIRGQFHLSFEEYYNVLLDITPNKQEEVGKLLVANN